MQFVLCYSLMDIIKSTTKFLIRLDQVSGPGPYLKKTSALIIDLCWETSWFVDIRVHLAPQSSTAKH